MRSSKRGSIKVSNKIRLFLFVVCSIFIVYIIKGIDIKGLLESGKRGLVQINNTKAYDKSIEPERSGSYPEIYAEAAVAVDVNSGKILFSKNRDRRMYPASITKLITALILAQKMDKQNILTYSARAKQQEANKLNFPKGSTMTAENAMQAMLVFSANDIAYMIGENVSGSSEEFAELMNKKAIELGLNDTHFVNACGLHNGNHYTTAYDLSILAREVYKNKWIMDTMGMESAHIEKTDGRGLIVYNTNTLLGKNGCIAGKTGHTSQAGKCLAAYYMRDDRVIISIVLNAPNDKALSNDMKKIVDWSFEN